MHTCCSPENIFSLWTIVKSLQAYKKSEGSENGRLYTGGGAAPVLMYTPYFGRENIVPEIMNFNF